MYELLSTSEIYILKIQRLLKLQISSDTLFYQLNYQFKKATKMSFYKFTAGVYNIRTWQQCKE